MTSASSLGELVLRLRGDGEQLLRTMNTAQAKVESSMAACAQAAKIGAGIMTAAFIAIGTVSVMEYAKFDKAMVQSLAIMGNVSQTQREEMEKTARTLATSTTTSARDAAQSFYFLASAGLNVATSIKALPVVERFAAAGAFDMAKATELLADSMSALGLASKDPILYLNNLTRVTDVLSTAANISNGSQEQFAVALRTKVAAAARIAGKDIEEVVAVLSAYADQGIKAENAGESLSIVMRDLGTAVMKEEKVWKAYGMEVYDTAGKMRPLVDMIEDFETLLGPLSDKEKKAAFEMMGFQERSVSALQSLVGTSAKIREYEKALRSAGGATKDVADKQLTSFSGQMQILKNRIDEVALSIGAQLTPQLRQLNDEFARGYAINGGYKETIDSLAKDMSSVLTFAIGGVITVLQGLYIVLLGVQQLWILLAAAIEYAYRWVSMAITAFATFGTVLGATLGAAIDSALHGIKSKMNEFLTWVREKQLAVQEWLNKVLPADVQKYDTSGLKKEIAELKAAKAALDANAGNADQSLVDVAGPAIAKMEAQWKEMQEYRKSINDGTDPKMKAIADIDDQINRIGAAGNPLSRAIGLTTDANAPKNDAAAAHVAQMASTFNNASIPLQSMQDTIKFNGGYDLTQASLAYNGGTQDQTGAIAVLKEGTASILKQQEDSLLKSLPVAFADSMKPTADMVLKATATFGNNNLQVADLRQAARVIASQTDSAETAAKRIPKYDPNVKGKDATDSEKKGVEAPHVWSVEAPSFSRTGLGTGTENRQARLAQVQVDILRDIKNLLEKKPQTTSLST